MVRYSTAAEMYTKLELIVLFGIGIDVLALCKWLLVIPDMCTRSSQFDEAKEDPQPEHVVGDQRLDVYLRS